LRGIADTSGQEANLTTASEKRIEGLTKAFDKFADGAEKRIVDIGTKMQSDLSKASREFMSEGVAATATYLDQERKLQEDYNRDRIRLIQDMNDDLLSAEEANDVIRFIQAQRAGEKNLARLDEDAGVEAKRRSEEFRAEQKERRKEYQQRLFDIKAAAAERISAEREKISERRALLAQQIADERAALTQQILDTRAAAVAMVQARRQQYAQELADQAKYNQQRAAIEANFMKQMAAAARSAAAYVAPTYKQVAKGTTGTTYTSSFSKASTGSTVNIGNLSVGAGMTQTSVMTALRSAFSSYQNAVTKAYVK